MRGEDTVPNDVKRIVTKSGNRVQFSDKAGKEAIVIATPRDLKLGMIEGSDENGRSVVLIEAKQGDIVFSAPNGRIHFQSKFFSREVGEEFDVSVSGPTPHGFPPAIPKPPAVEPATGAAPGHPSTSSGSITARVEALRAAWTAVKADYLARDMKYHPTKGVNPAKGTSDCSHFVCDVLHRLGDHGLQYTDCQTDNALEDAQGPKNNWTIVDKAEPGDLIIYTYRNEKGKTEHHEAICSRPGYGVQMGEAKREQPDRNGKINHVHEYTIGGGVGDRPHKTSFLRRRESPTFQAD